MSLKATDHLSPLAADVRMQNPDRYLATLFAPPAYRDSLFALYAFDHEMARIQTMVREPVAGLIRLQWWQDVIDGFERGNTVAHPVVEGLRRAVMEGGLKLAYLRRAIDGRRQPFEEDLPSTTEAFEQHLHDIGGGVTCAAAALLGASDRATLAAANRVGKATAAWEQCRILEMSTADHGSWLPPVWRERQGDKARNQSRIDAQMRLAEWASAELIDARHQQPSIARSALAAFFPGTLVGIRLADPIRSIMQPVIPTAVPRLFWYWLRGRF